MIEAQRVASLIYDLLKADTAPGVGVNTLTGGQRFGLCAAATSGPAGEIAFPAWVDDSKAGADKSGRAIEGRPLPVPAAGF